MSADPGTVHVVDDDVSWRASVARLLAAAGYRVVLYESAEQFLDTCELDAPGCVLLDLRMPGLTGLQLQQRLGQHTLPVVFVSGHGDIPTSVLAIKAGAEDFLSKPVDSGVLLSAIERAIARDRAERDERRQHDALRARVDGLTPSERKVFDAVVLGRLNKQIAAEPGTAERTIKWHRRNLMEKLRVDSLAELVSLAERLGMVGTQDRPKPGAK
jgi:FixJ family two-component response regulator